MPERGDSRSPRRSLKRGAGVSSGFWNQCGSKGAASGAVTKKKLLGGGHRKYCRLEAIATNVTRSYEPRKGTNLPQFVAPSSGGVSIDRGRPKALDSVRKPEHSTLWSPDLRGPSQYSGSLHQPGFLPHTKPLREQEKRRNQFCVKSWAPLRRGHLQSMLALLKGLGETSVVEGLTRCRRGTTRDCD